MLSSFYIEFLVFLVKKKKNPFYRYCHPRRRHPLVPFDDNITYINCANTSSLFSLQDFNSVLVNGSCQIPDPLYKLIGSIVSFYIPLGVMILTYTLTVRHLAAKRQNLQTGITTHSSNQSNFYVVVIGSLHNLSAVLDPSRGR